MTEQNKQVTEAQALEALDNLDDYAKMAISVDPVGPREILHRFIEQNNQPPAEAGEGAVAKIIRNASGQITIQGPDGDYFDMSEHIGATLYTSQTTATQAAVAAAMINVRPGLRAAGINMGLAGEELEFFINDTCSNVIPAEATAALMEFGVRLLEGAGLGNWPANEIDALIDRILAEKGK
jgi:hypothetical protein